MENKFQIVKIKKSFKEYNIEKDMYGILIERNNEYCSVIIPNDKIWGDYAVVQMTKQDLSFQTDKISDDIKESLKKFVSGKNNLNKSRLQMPQYKEFDLVRLKTEKYKALGLYKNETGVVVNENIVSNKILVDFSGVDENGNCYGDCISVSINDIEKI